MQRLIWTILVSFIMATVLGPIVIPWLKRMKFGQTIYDLGPESHKKKQGVPTMGGIIFFIAAFVCTLIFSIKSGANIALLVMALLPMVGFGAVGFVDDFIKVKLKRSLGLTPKQKLIPQIVIAIALSVWAYLTPEIGSKLIVPFVNWEWDLGIIYIPVMVFILVGTVNSANLLDGLDGLCAGCSLFDFITMMLICLLMASTGGAMSNDYMNMAIYAAAMSGALLGFLRFNSHPAGVFMGDVGSFTIGGALMGLMLVTRLSLLLPIIALAMMMSSVSDLIQFAYFRATHGKRFFKMAPLHHHFELSGMPETRVVSMYYIVTVCLCLVALLGFVA